MATYTHPVTGEQLEYIPFEELSPEDRDRVTSEEAVDRWAAAKAGLGLDRLVSDPSWCVRAAVARRR